ncbi:MAG: helix-hairpin-helix domain-containing protein [Holophagales bacterium]|nr:helix-hairpin-helix domain-containing protein [Holophagales bacterium]
MTSQALSAARCFFLAIKRALQAKNVIAVIVFINFAFCASAPVYQKKGPVRLVNINTATRTELIQIPKIGEKTADQIVEFRKINGPFKRIEEIMSIKGIGEKTFLSIKPYITVGSQPANKNKNSGNIEITYGPHYEND